MKGLLGSSINIAPPPAREIPKREILWVGERGGDSAFPKHWEARHRKTLDDPEPLRAFGSAVASALERVWILDGYFLAPEGDDREVARRIPMRIRRIEDWLLQARDVRDIRILTSKHAGVTPDVLNKHIDTWTGVINDSRSHAILCTIQIRYHLKDSSNYIHDRFAIVDEELWHFGGTAGGFHTSVSAVTRGWRAVDHNAVEFFEEAWNQGCVG